MSIADEEAWVHQQVMDYLEHMGELITDERDAYCGFLAGIVTGALSQRANLISLTIACQNLLEDKT